MCRIMAPRTDIKRQAGGEVACDVGVYEYQPQGTPGGSVYLERCRTDDGAGGAVGVGAAPNRLVILIDARPRLWVPERAR